MKLLSLLLLCSLLPIQSATPTLDETLQWLQESLPVQAISIGKIGNSGVSERISQAEFKKCSAVITTETAIVNFGSLRSTIQSKREFSFALDSMDAEKVHILSYIDKQLRMSQPEKDDGGLVVSLIMRTNNDQSLVKISSYFDNGMSGVKNTNSLAKRVSLPMPNQETADKFQKAFVQAIRLCQASK